MNTARKVVDALALAVNRLHEPPVLVAYRQLLELVDLQLGGQIMVQAQASLLTEPQLVFIAYGLKHVRGAQAVPLLRAADVLIAALSEVYNSKAVVLEPESPLVEHEERNREAKPPTPSMRVRMRQNFGSITNSHLTIVGNQNYYALPPAPVQQEAVIEEETETAEAVSESTTLYDIFLSYSRPNAEQMRRLRTDLRSYGLYVWTDVYAAHKRCRYCAPPMS